MSQHIYPGHGLGGGGVGHTMLQEGGGGEQGRRKSCPWRPCPLFIVINLLGPAAYVCGPILIPVSAWGITINQQSYSGGVMGWGGEGVMESKTECCRGPTTSTLHL